MVNLEKKLDSVFSLFIRLRDSNSKGFGRCISCKKPIFFRDAHNCHYIPRGDKKYRYSEDNCHLGCSSCNTYREGYHYAKYTVYMTEKFGEKGVAEMWKHWEAKTPHKIRTYELRDMIETYNAKIDALLLTKSPNVRAFFTRGKKTKGAGGKKGGTVSGSNRNLRIQEGE